MQKSRTLVIGFMFGLLCLSTAAQTVSLTEQAYAAYQQKNYAKSAELYQAAIRAGDRDPNTTYNAACSFALIGKKDESFALLDASLQLFMDDPEQYKNDPDFKNLYTDARWEGFLKRAAAQREKSKRFWESPALVTPYQPVLSEDEKVAGLSKIWSEARFNFVNFGLVPELDWDKLYLDTLPKVRAAQSTADYYRELLLFIAQLKDGHTNVYPPEALTDEFSARPLIATRLVEGRVFIRRVYDDKLKAEGIEPGLEITAINGLPVKQYAETKVMAFQSVSTPQDLQVRSYESALLNGRADEPLVLTLQDAAGKTTQKTLPRATAKERVAANLPRLPNTEFKILPGNIGYFSINNFENEAVVKEFVAAWPQLSQTAALIFDVRYNGGGNSGLGWEILSYLTDKPFATSQWGTRLYRPAFRAWGTPDGWHDGGTKPRAPKGTALYTKPVAVLISPRTFSAAEDFAVAFDQMKSADGLARGTLIGEPTGGSTGQPLFFRLPGGGSARVCSKRDRYADGREFVGIGIQPHIPIAPTVSDFRAGRDTVLDAAIAHLNKAIK